MGVFGHHLGFEFDPFGADGHGGGLAHLAHIHRGGVDHVAIGQPHRRLVALKRGDGAAKRVIFANEARDKAVIGAFIQGRWRGQLLDAAIVEDGDAVRHGQRLALIVGHINHGDAKTFVQGLDFKLHMFTQLLVQSPQRFIHQHQFRIEDQCARQGDALLLAA